MSSSSEGNLVVYTCHFGGYGTLVDPFPPGSGGFEKICFTDDPKLKSDSWEIVVLDESGLGPRVDSRLPKLLPHRYLQDFEVSLYCDSRVQFLVNPLEIQRSGSLEESPMTCFEHPWRDCLYEEGEVVIERGLCAETDVRRQLSDYRRQGYPTNHGLIAGTVLLRRHNDPLLMETSELWSTHFLHYCHRDQLSFNFVAWLKGLEYSTFQGTLVDNPNLKWVSRSDMKVIPSDFDEQRFEWLVPEVAGSGLTARQYYLEHWDGKDRPDKRNVSTLERLANKYQTDKGTLHFNAHGYARAYELYLSKLQDRSFNMLEIGLLRPDVQARNPEGPYDDVPSLKMWREYFDKATIVGFDIADFSTAPPMKNVAIIQGDMGNSSDLDRAVDEVPGDYTVIIDDASHASHHQQIAFGHLFPKLAKDGFYVIEDLHYQPSGLEEKGAVKTVDVLRGLESGALIDSPYLPQEAQEELATWIEFIHLFDSQDRQFGRIHRDALAVIKKRSRAGAALVRGRRRTRALVERLLPGSPPK